jgi:hypothetical protein
MQLIKPITVNESNLTSSNVAEDDAAFWNSSTSYNDGDEVIYGTRVYESLVGSNQNNIPSEDDGTNWLDIGATNRYTMFDESPSSQTTNSGTIEVEITPGETVNGVAIINGDGESVTVVVDDPYDGEVYNETQAFAADVGITNWFDYFYAPIINRTDLVFLDLPAYPSATITVTVDAGAGTAKCGELVMGYTQTLGRSQWGYGVSIQDYSVKATNAFGNTVITQRAFAKRIDIDVFVEPDQVGAVQRALTDVRSTAAVYVGDANREETIVYGFYKNFDIVVQNYGMAMCSLEVEGLT